MILLRRMRGRALSGAAWMCAAALAVAGCGASQARMSDAVGAELGAADGAAAGERAAWGHWNALVERYDGAFASLIARRAPEIDPARARFVEWAVLEQAPNEAVVEEGIWVLEEPKLAPYGTRGFADALAVRYLPAASGAADGGDGGLPGPRPQAYSKAYIEAWEAAYVITMHERELALEAWMEDRYAIFQADVLIARGQVVPPTVERAGQPASAGRTRRAEKREIWTLSGGVFSQGSRARSGP